MNEESTIKYSSNGMWCGCKVLQIWPGIKEWQWQL